jgi:hypothetical protein
VRDRARMMLEELVLFLTLMAFYGWGIWHLVAHTLGLPCPL